MLTKIEKSETMYNVITSVFLLLLSVETIAANYVLDIRDDGKICTEWFEPVTGIGVAYSYERNPECDSSVSLEHRDSNREARLCCKGIPSTTLPPYFPKECGKQLYAPFSSRIYGGSVASKHSWPWQVLIRGPINQCGGTLIGERHVLTAASCFPKIEQGYYPVKVTIGLHNIYGTRFMDQEISAEKIYVHERYYGKFDDIALIYLSNPVNVTDKVNFICLPGPEAPIGVTTYNIGWGKPAELTTADWSPQLKQTSLNIMKCDGFYAPDQYDNEKQICASANGGSPCGGDRGGPLMYHYAGQWYLNGIYISNGCRSDDRPIFFTRVSYYLPWIQEKMALATPM